MNYPLVLKTLGMLLCFIGLSMLAPMLVAVYFDEGDAVHFAKAIGVTLALGVGLLLPFRKVQANPRRKDAFAIVGLAWLVISACGALPYWFDGTFPSYIDAYFETMSGFTTAGASVMTNIEVVSRAILFWRAMTHWFGGIGIIVLFVAILPILGVGGRELFFTEAPGPISEGLKPKITQTARTLLLIYNGLILTQMLILKFLGLGWFESLCHAMATLSSGGFSTRNASIAAFNSPAVEWVTTIFMFAAGTNFSLYYLALQGHWRSALRDQEMRVYATVCSLAVLAIAIQLLYLGYYESFVTSARYAAFQVATVATSTGFATADFDQWPEFSKALLVVLTFIGGSAGSTSGGIKVIRFVVILKILRHEMIKSYRPHRIIPLRLGKRVISDEIKSNIVGFVYLYIGLMVVSTLVLTLLPGTNLVTAFTAVNTCMANCGPGLESVGPTVNYFWLHPLGKMVLIFNMLAGRLEIITLALLFYPRFWSRRG